MRSLVVVLPEIDNADVEHAQEQKRSNRKCDGPHPDPHFAHVHVSNFAREPFKSLGRLLVTCPWPASNRSSGKHVAGQAIDPGACIPEFGTTDLVDFEGVRKATANGLQ